MQEKRQELDIFLTWEAIYDITDITEYIEIYQKNFSPSIIFYIIKDDAVHVLRVLRHEQDWKNLLKRQKQYTYPDGSTF